MALFNVLIKICWFVFLVLWVILGVKAKKNLDSNHTRESWFLRLAVIVVVILFSKIKVFHSLDNNGVLSSNRFIQVCGVLLCVVGIGFAIWARIYLGKNWGMPMSLKKEPELVTTGPYQFVRHPIYTGLCIAMIGSFFVEGFTWLIWLLFMGGYFIYSATKEEKSMLLQFPEKYAEYMSRTKMLIPFIF